MWRECVVLLSQLPAIARLENVGLSGDDEEEEEGNGMRLPPLYSVVWPPLISTTRMVNDGLIDGIIYLSKMINDDADSPFPYLR